MLRRIPIVRGKRTRTDLSRSLTTTTRPSKPSIRSSAGVAAKIYCCKVVVGYRIAAENLILLVDQFVTDRQFLENNRDLVCGVISSREFVSTLW